MIHLFLCKTSSSVPNCGVWAFLEPHVCRKFQIVWDFLHSDYCQQLFGNILISYMEQRTTDTEIPSEFLIPVLMLHYGGKWFLRDWCWDWYCFGAAEWTVESRMVMALSCVAWSALQGRDPWQAGEVGPCKPYETSSRPSERPCLWARAVPEQRLLISSGLCGLWGCGRRSFSTCARGTDVWNSTQWIGQGQSCFGSYLGVKVKAADVSSSHLSAAGLLLKAHS